MGQKITIRWFWRKKKNGTKGIQPEPESIWIDIAKRTGKTFVQVTLGVVGTLLINPPDKWKPALIAAISTGACAAMNYFIKRVQELVGDPDETAPEIGKGDSYVQTENDETGER